MTHTDVQQVYGLVMEAAAVLYAAVNTDLEASLELADVLVHVDRAESYLVPFGPSHDPAAIPMGAVTVDEAASRARDLLREALDAFPRESIEREDLAYSASAAVSEAIRGLRGWA